MSAALYSLVKPVLFRMDAEDAHHATLSLLEELQHVPGALDALAWAFRAPHTAVTVAGLTFRNPVGLAAGFDKNGTAVAALAALGFGFVEVGTVTPRAQPGNPRPRMFRYPEDGAVVNRLGFNNQGVDAVARNLEHLVRPAGLVLGANVGKNADVSLEDAPRDYAHGMRVLYDLADYFTLNISSPNTKDLRRLHEPALLQPLFDAAMNVQQQARVQKPVFLKVSPDAADEDLVRVAQVAAAHGVGLMATNTTVDRSGPHADKQAGGMSGTPVRARAEAVMRLLRSATDGRVPLVGVGGIMEGPHAVERMKAGADLVQVYSGLVFRGPGLVAEILRALARAEAE